jgi:hypothetical protein
MISRDSLKNQKTVARRGLFFSGKYGNKFSHRAHREIDREVASKIEKILKMQKVQRNISNQEIRKR